MNQVSVYFLSGLLVSLLLYVLIQGLPTQQEPSQDSVEEAASFYQLGENAKTVGERKTAFNKALSLYLNMENSFHPDFGNGKLFYNIANTYYQLDETPLSIYYYNRAIQLDPRDPAAAFNLQQAQTKLKLPKEADQNFHNILTLSPLLSLPERIHLFFWSIVILVALASLYIFQRHFWLKPAMGIVGACSLLLAISLFYTRYISPQEAILIKSSTLYRDAGTQYAAATAEPIPAGSKVEVITAQKEGAWIKILTPEGYLGYVQSDSIKLL